MAIAITIRMEGWESPEWVRDQLAPDLPDVDIWCVPDVERPEDVVMLVCDRLPAGLAERFPNLRVLQKLGAGVETMVRDPGVGPDVRITRLKAAAAAREIAEYCIYHVLRESRHMRLYEQQQQTGVWEVHAPPLTPDITVAVLGLGHIGGLIARRFSALEFRTIGWSLSQKDIAGVECRAGGGALAGVLGQADFVVSILPSTDKTRGLMNADTLSLFKDGAMLINVGRGDLVIDEDMLAALARNRPGRAVLDVMASEPLPADHPYWGHAQVALTPHISGWSVVDGIRDVAENYRRLTTGGALLHEIDRAAGY